MKEFTLFTRILLAPIRFCLLPVAGFIWILFALAGEEDQGDTVMEFILHFGTRHIE